MTILIYELYMQLYLDVTTCTRETMMIDGSFASGRTIQDRQVLK